MTPSEPYLGVRVYGGPPSDSVPAASSPAAGTDGWLEFVVYGQPAPQGSKKHVGKGVMVESSDAVRPWRDAVRADSATARAGRPPLDGPLMLTVTFTLRRPAGAPKRRRAWPTKRPDLDKIVRATFDGLTDGGAWADDARVVTVLATKVYAGDPAALDAPGARIAISPIEEI